MSKLPRLSTLSRTYISAIIIVLSIIGSISITSCIGKYEEKINSKKESGKLIEDLQGKRVLFVYGGWDGHNPVQCKDLYVPWLREVGAEVVTSDSLGIYADSVFMETVDLVIQIWTMGEITKPQLEGLLLAVENGTGLAGWHGGLGDAFRNEPSYQFMIGGQWVAHPGDIIDYSVQIKDHSDPITKDLNDFTLHSEQYYMHVDPNVHVLATTTFSGKHAYWIDGHTMPVAWKTTFGKGRVFYNSVGHRIEDHAVPEFATMMRRGFLWACR